MKQPKTEEIINFDKTASVSKLAIIEINGSTV